MGKNRLEAFSDGIIAIMVLELKIPHDPTFAGPLPLCQVFMSFVYVSICWSDLQYGRHFQIFPTSNY